MRYCHKLPYAIYLCAGGIIAFSPLLIRLLAAENYLSSANVKYFVRKR